MSNNDQNKLIIRTVKEPRTIDSLKPRYTRKPGVTLTSYEIRSAYE